MPDVGEVPNATWRKRCARLGYVEVADLDGGIRSASKLGFSITHAGYGAGYGGSRPVSLVSAVSRSGLHSDLVWDVRRLFGLSPMPAPYGPAPAIAPP